VIFDGLFEQALFLFPLSYLNFEEKSSKFRPLSFCQIHFFGC